MARARNAGGHALTPQQTRKPVDVVPLESTLPGSGRLPRPGMAPSGGAAPVFSRPAHDSARGDGPNSSHWKYPFTSITRCEVPEGNSGCTVNLPKPSPDNASKPLFARV